MSKYAKNIMAVFVTCPTQKEAERIADSLLRKRLIACANIIGGIKSKFRWKGKVDEADEYLLIMKTAEAKFGKLEKETKELHSYEVPEIIALPVTAGGVEYLKWVESCLGSRRR